jgi:hypothetical protein
VVSDPIFQLGLEFGRGESRSLTANAEKAAPMNIHLERSGGFAGLRQSSDLESSQLSQEEGDELNRLVETSGFFDLPAEVRATAPGADRFQYKLTVNDGARTHTVALDEAAVPERLRPLLNWVISKVRKQ